MKKLQTRFTLAISGLMLAFGATGGALAQSSPHSQHGSPAGATTQQHGQHATSGGMTSQQQAQHGTAGMNAQQHSMPGHEMMQSMQEMHQKMSSMKMTGDHDHDFAMMMRSHHQAGLDMARAELKHGKDAQMKQMARKIISDQTKEIKKLDQWMAKHHAPHK